MIKGRVLPCQEAIDQLNAIDFVIHNIAPCPQLCGLHTGGLHYSLMLCFVAAKAAALAKRNMKLSWSGAKGIEDCRIKEAAFIRYLDKGRSFHMLLFDSSVPLDSPPFCLLPLLNILG